MVIPVNSSLASPAPSLGFKRGTPVGASLYLWDKELEPRSGVLRWSVVASETGRQRLCEIVEPGEDELLLAVASNCLSVAGRTRHRSLANVLEAGWLKDGAFFAILDLSPEEKEWLDPGNLRLVSEEDFLIKADRLIDALMHMHKSEILHCAICPAVLRQDDDSVKLGEFWWARDLKGQAFDGRIDQYYPSELAHMAALCMAPELLRGARPSRESDLYALGCVFFFFLTGQFPRLVEDERAATLRPRDLAGARLKSLADLRPGLEDKVLKAVELMLDDDPVRREDVFLVHNLIQDASGRFDVVSEEE